MLLDQYEITQNVFGDWVAKIFSAGFLLLLILNFRAPTYKDLYRFRCIEEYVLVDELGNIIENDGKQQQHKKKPSQTPLNHQAHRDFYTKKVASLFHSNSHNTSILTTTTAKPLLGNVRDDFPRPTATIAPNASVQQSVLSAEYMSTMGQNPIAQGLSIRRLPANNTRRFDQRYSEY